MKYVFYVSMPEHLIKIGKKESLKHFSEKIEEQKFFNPDDKILYVAVDEKQTTRIESLGE